MTIRIYSGPGRETAAGNKSRRIQVFLLEASEDPTEKLSARGTPLAWTGREPGV